MPLACRAAPDDDPTPRWFVTTHWSVVLSAQQRSSTPSNSGMWQLRREVASFEHEGHVRLVLFSPDGNALATVTDTEMLRVFRAATAKEADEIAR